MTAARVRISGQLTGNAIGQYLITVTVTDLQGATVPHRFTIKVMSPTNLGDAEKTPCRSGSSCR